MLEKGKISSNQYVLLLILFVLGIGGLMFTAPSAGESSWLLYLLASFWGMLLLYIYSCILKSFPGKTIIEILPKVFGNILGRIISLFFISYFLLLTSLILRTVSDFLTIILPKTPIVVSAVTYILLAGFAVRIGIEVIGRVAEFVTPIVILIQALTIIFAFPDLDFTNLQPLLAEGVKPFLFGLIGASGFPFGELVVFLMILPFLNLGSMAHKTSVVGMLIVGFLYSIFIMRVILILGPLTADINYSSFQAVSFIQAGDIIERWESFFLLAYLMTAFIKLLMCFYAASLGMAQVFNLKDYRFLVNPLALLAVSLSILLFENRAIPFVSSIYPLYVICLSFFLPLLILLVSKLRKRGKIKGNQ